MTDEELAASANLATATVDAFAEGRGYVMMPEDRRVEVASTLLKLMFDKEALEVYRHALKEEREKRGIGFDAARWPGVIFDPLSEQIASKGFGSLPTEELASLAISPLGLLIVRSRIRKELRRLPAWLYQALVDKLW